MIFRFIKDCIKYIFNWSFFSYFSIVGILGLIFGLQSAHQVNVDLQQTIQINGIQHYTNAAIFKFHMGEIRRYLFVLLNLLYFPSVMRLVTNIPFLRNFFNNFGQPANALIKASNFAKGAYNNTDTGQRPVVRRQGSFLVFGLLNNPIYNGAASANALVAFIISLVVSLIALAGMLYIWNYAFYAGLIIVPLSVIWDNMIQTN